MDISDTLNIQEFLAPSKKEEEDYDIVDGYMFIYLMVNCLHCTLLLPLARNEIVCFCYIRSTDFEVHRNWLAVTYSLPITKWYQDETSPWTLDYPPFFAWFEYGLSLVAQFFDSKMLVITNLKYASDETILFQRLSVIVSDFLLAYSIKRCVNVLCKISKQAETEKFFIFMLFITNAGLLIVDHIHFQYNGFLFGLLFMSISAILEGSCLKGAFWFAVLLNFKHIFLYMAPAYFVYLLRSYCFSSNSNKRIIWKSFSLKKFIILGSTVAGVFTVSFGPFIASGQISQVLTRLFPFKRGLTHAYWAPNFWAMYNFIDKVVTIAASKSGIFISTNKASMTGGLVQEFDHGILPSISPLVTFVLTFITMLPALMKLWNNPNNPWQFVRTLCICGFSSYMFGWHVHEKAILLVTLPMGLLACINKEDAHLFELLNIIGNFSLFPLIFTPKETIIKVSVFLFHATYVSFNLQKIWNFENGFVNGLQKSECLYMIGLFFVYLYDAIIHQQLPWLSSLEFLPLMLISVYCAIGIFYVWVKYYITCLKINVVLKPMAPQYKRESIHKKRK